MEDCSFWFFSRALSRWLPRAISWAARVRSSLGWEWSSGWRSSGFGALWEAGGLKDEVIEESRAFGRVGALGGLRREFDRFAAKRDGDGQMPSILGISRFVSTQEPQAHQFCSSILTCDENSAEDTKNSITTQSSHVLLHNVLLGVSKVTSQALQSYPTDASSWQPPSTS